MKAITNKAEDNKQNVSVIKTSMYIPSDLKNKVEYIAFMDDGVDSQTSFMLDAIKEAVAKWEKKNGEAVKK